MGLIALGGLAALVGFLVTGCSKDKKEVETHKEEDIIETLKEQEMEDSKKLVVAGAKVLCTSCEGAADNVLMQKDKGGEVTNGALELNHKDIVFAPLFPTCKYTDDLKCTPDIEKEEWQGYDEMHKTGDGNYGLIKETSYMFCLNGAGIIYISEDGQMEKEMEELWARLLFDKWWNGEDFGAGRIMRAEIEHALNVLERNGELPDIEKYVSKEQLVQIYTKDNVVNWYMLADLNRVLKNYDITTLERISHFLGQCVSETGICEGLPIEIGDQNYYKRLSYFPYIGTGYIQLTHDTNYMAFATYKALEAFPELNEDVVYRNPNNWPMEDSNTGKGILPSYNNLKEAAKRKGYDISDYTDIYELGGDIDKIDVSSAEYVAKEFGWEAAAYFWEIGDCNSIVDSFKSENKNNADEITKKVNSKDNTYKKRQDNYEKVRDILRE